MIKGLLILCSVSTIIIRRFIVHGSIFANVWNETELGDIFAHRNQASTLEKERFTHYLEQSSPTEWMNY